MSTDISRMLLLNELDARGWQYKTFGQEDRYLHIYHPDGRENVLFGSTPLQTSGVGRQMCKYKHLTLEYTQQCGYQVPAYLVTDDFDTGAMFMRDNQRVVVKPLDGAQTRGVSVGIHDEPGLRAAIDHARLYSRSTSGRVMVQRHVDGKLYRLLVLNGSLVAAGLRTAAAVRGDGESSVRQLIEYANQDPRRSVDGETPLKAIDMQHAELFLGIERLAQVPQVNEIVTVSAIDSVSAGGEAQNVTDTVHETWRTMVVDLANKFGLFIAGFDVICDDISRPLEGDYIPLLEINTDPGFKLHEYPTAGGDPIHIAPLLLDALF